MRPRANRLRPGVAALVVLGVLWVLWGVVALATDLAAGLDVLAEL